MKFLIVDDNTKPVDLDQFISVVESIEDFWLTIVRLPPDGER